MLFDCGVNDRRRLVVGFHEGEHYYSRRFQTNAYSLAGENLVSRNVLFLFSSYEYVLCPPPHFSFASFSSFSDAFYNPAQLNKHAGN